MSPAMRRAKLAMLCEIEGFDDEYELFAAAIADSVVVAEAVSLLDDDLALHAGEVGNVGDFHELLPLLLLCAKGERGRPLRSGPDH